MEAILERPVAMPPRVQPCPVCGGKGYISIETRETVTICADQYPITYPVVGYKTVSCWRCRGTRRVESDHRAA